MSSRLVVTLPSGKTKNHSLTYDDLHRAHLGCLWLQRDKLDSPADYQLRPVAEWGVGLDEVLCVLNDFYISSDYVSKSHMLEARKTLAQRYSRKVPLRDTVFSILNLGVEDTNLITFLP